MGDIHEWGQHGYDGSSVGLGSSDHLGSIAGNGPGHWGESAEPSSITSSLLQHTNSPSQRDSDSVIELQETSVFRDSVCGPSADDRYSGVRMLWIKVIIRAIYDWITYRDSTKFHFKKLAESAEIWMFQESYTFNSFDNICRYISLEPDMVRGRIKLMSKEDAKKIEFLDRVSYEDIDEDEQELCDMFLEEVASKSK